MSILSFRVHFGFRVGVRHVRMEKAALPIKNVRFVKALEHQMESSYSLVPEVLTTLIRSQLR